MFIWKERPEAMARVEILWAEGRSLRQIAHIITAEFRLVPAITRNAVVGIVHRMRLPPRPSPIIRDGRAPKRERPDRIVRRKSRADLTPPAITLPALPSASIPAPAPTPDPIEPMSRPAPIVRGTCCWPIGEPKRPGFRFCDAPAIAGKPYCFDHYKIAYLPPPKVHKWLRPADKRAIYTGPYAVTVR